MKNLKSLSLLITLFIMFSCEKEQEIKPSDPDKAEIVPVDRFNSDAAVLMVRNDTNNLPGPNEAIDFDNTPGMLTKGFGPNGKKIEYYNFDVQPLDPAPIWLLFKEGSETKVEGQLTILEHIPGDDGYSDFWQVYKVTVPNDYQANTLTSFQDVLKSKYPVEVTNILVNCPVVPKGSKAEKRFKSEEDPTIQRGWYKGKIVHYFSFFEKDITLTSENKVPLSDIFVCFNVNPGNDGGGPSSGAKTEDNMIGGQTHGITETIPTDESYSPLWSVQVYNNSDFDNVTNLQSAQGADLLLEDAMYVNCPVVWVE